MLRPECPLGHRGQPTLHGRYAVSEFHERVRWHCAAGRHTFSVPLPSRHPRPSHPHAGSACAYCERAYTAVDGPITGRGFTFSLREIAAALVAVGQGRSLGEAAVGARRNAQREQEGPYNISTVSRETPLVASWIDAFADTVLAGTEPDHWPRVLAVDAIPLRERQWRDGRWIEGGHNNGAILAAYGYLQSGERKDRVGLLWKVAIAGSNDQASWVEFLRSLPDDPEGPPTWIIADGDGAIRKAITTVWPEAQFFACEWHLKHRAAGLLGQPIGPPGTSPILDALDKALRSEENWQAFLSMLDAYSLKRTEKVRRWVAKNEDLIARQRELRTQGYSRSIGPLEGMFDRIQSRLASRTYVFRNVERLNKVLRLMRADLVRQADEHAYYRRLRDHLAAQEGRALVHWETYRIGHQGTALEVLVGRAKAATRKRLERNNQTRKRRTHERRRTATQEAVARARRIPRRMTRREVEPVRGRMLSEFAEPMADWDDALNPGLDPATMHGGSQRKVTWRCARDPSHIWQALVISRTARHAQCPYCTNRFGDASNSLEVGFPLVAAEWHKTRNGALRASDVSYGSEEKVWWKCPKGHVYRAAIRSRTSLQTGCPRCHGGRPPKA